MSAARPKHESATEREIIEVSGIAGYAWVVRLVSAAGNARYAWAEGYLDWEVGLVSRLRQSSVAARSWAV